MHHADYIELLKELTELAVESMRREIALAKLEAEVEAAIRKHPAELPVWAESLREDMAKGCAGS